VSEIWRRLCLEEDPAGFEGAPADLESTEGQGRERGSAKDSLFSVTPVRGHDYLTYLWDLVRKKDDRPLIMGSAAYGIPADAVFEHRDKWSIQAPSVPVVNKLSDIASCEASRKSEMRAARSPLKRGPVRPAHF